MKEGNLILEKSYSFLLRIIKLYKYLSEEKREYILSKQILRSGTSIGANVEEAVGGQSFKDFASKIGIAYKEARETRYWIRLLRDGQYLENSFADSILNDCNEICRILSKIQITCNNQ
jgi:four helix bundle protein